MNKILPLYMFQCFKDFKSLERYFTIKGKFVMYWFHLRFKAIFN